MDNKNNLKIRMLNSLLSPPWLNNEFWTQAQKTNVSIGEKVQITITCVISTKILY